MFLFSLLPPIFFIIMNNKQFEYFISIYFIMRRKAYDIHISDQGRIIKASRKRIYTNIVTELNALPQW